MLFRLNSGDSSVVSVHPGGYGSVVLIYIDQTRTGRRVVGHDFNSGLLRMAYCNPHRPAAVKA